MIPHRWSPLTFPLQKTRIRSIRIYEPEKRRRGVLMCGEVRKSLLKQFYLSRKDCHDSTKILLFKQI
jgi:hypothetical protein